MIDFKKLGKLLNSIEVGPEYEETLVKKLRGCRVNMDTIKDYQEHVQLLPNSSDSAVVRALCCAIRDQTDLIAGMATTIDALLSQNVTLSCALQKANSYIAEQAQKTLPGNRRFTAENLTKSWSLEENPPFKATDLRLLLERWRRPTRSGENDHYTHIMDFCRFYFIKACNPVVEIQRYACRLTGKHGKDATLRDLPEDIVNFMIDFILDAIGLGHEDIELDVEHFLTQPSLFWCKLGDNDADRGRVLKELRSSRIEWSSLIRRAIGRALTDVRSYRYRAEDNTLVPSNKRKSVSSEP